MDLSLFKKVDTTPARGAKMDGEMVVRMNRKGYRTVLSAGVVRELGWKPGDKVSLYRMGGTFALNREVAGTMKLNANSGCKRTSSLVICNQKMWLETVPHSGDSDTFHAWVEEGVVFFKRTAENK